MVQVGEAVNINGHLVTRMAGKKSEPWEYECDDCGVRGPHGVYSVGTHGCAGRPESLDNLSVCPGGEACSGHMDQASPQFSTWEASKSMSSDEVPRYQCSAGELGVRAARQYRDVADKIGMRMRTWEQSGRADKVGAGGGAVAAFHHENGTSYQVSVSATGQITCEREQR
jgi:hypothetical protein